MNEHIRTVRLGAATVTVINVGEIHVKLTDWIDLPEHARLPDYTATFEQPLRLPVQSIHVRLPGLSLLVDAGAYDRPSGAAATAPGSQPPPDLAAGLAEGGITPEEITHVVITHAHHDHFSATTCLRDEQYVPRFPNARYYFGRADWEEAELQKALTDPQSLAGRTLAVLDRHGLLELVEGERDLGVGVRIIAAPGETPGHQIVRIHSEGSTLYGVGDLYHHPVEIERPDWTVRWSDTEANLASRNAFVQAALAENALLVATHIATIGRLERTASGVTLVAAD